jgi:ribosome-associated protein
MLIDFGSVIVHIFSPPQRAYYQLEELWQDAPIMMRML